MSLKCLIHGHTYEKVDEMWQEDLQDSFYASNNSHCSVKSYSYNVYRCSRCLREKVAYSGKTKIETT